MFRKLIHPTAFFKKPVRGFVSQVLHVTDAEGTDFAFKSILNSSLVHFRDNGLHFANNHTHFIYGGDATDRGVYDIGLTRLLVDFKKRHPDKVSLLVGNREIKNRRFGLELNPDFIRERLLETKPVYWVTPATSPLDYVLADMRSKGKFLVLRPNEASIREHVNGLSILECQTLYLKWMLEKTMGSPNTFRYRGLELARLSNKAAVSEEEIVNSFLETTTPTGPMGQYLQLADVGVIVPNTNILAVHGGLTLENLGRVPDMTEADAPIADAKSWINRFNQWYKDQIQTWIATPANPQAEPGSTALDESVLPRPDKSKFVITANALLNAQGQFDQIPEGIVDYLKRNNINMVLTGHWPCGDHPGIVRSQDNSVLLINGDTGYAKPTNDQDNTRGPAKHTLEISVDEQAVHHVHLDATLSNAVDVTTRLRVSASGISGDPYIGKVIENHQLVQCHLPNGYYRLAQQKTNGFGMNYTTVKADELDQKLQLNTAIKFGS